MRHVFIHFKEPFDVFLFIYFVAYTIDRYRFFVPRLGPYCANSCAKTVSWITKPTTFIELVIFGGKQFNRSVGIASTAF